MSYIWEDTKIQKCMWRRNYEGINLVNACYHSVLNFPFSYLRLYRVKYTELNFACRLYGYETWLFTLREERRLGMFENRLPRNIFERKRKKTGAAG